MKLLVLAGGFGTRLQALLPAQPKALAPVGGVPFLQMQIEHWRAQGIHSFAFLLYHQADLIVSFLQREKQAGALIGCEVRWLVEPKPMDTGGAVAYAVERIGLTGSFLVTNADSWLGTGIADVIRAKSPAMAVIRLQDASRYGRVQFDQQQRVTTFDEKNNFQGAGWINAGLCHLNAETFRDWNQLPFSLERLTFPAMVASGELQAITLETDFIDIGVPDDYYRFCRWIAADRKGTLWS
jgi:D-glycero-alpha-D-manno-heptose 1-phosphate guanylyltransferase